MRLIFRILFLQFFLFFLIISSYAQRDSMTRIDSLEFALQSAKEDSGKVNLLVSLSQEYRKSDLNKAHETIILAKQLAQKIKFEHGIGVSLSLEGVVKFIQGKFNEAAVLYDSSLVYLEKFPEKKGIANLHIYYGILHANREKFDSAIFHYKLAADLFLLQNDQSGLASSYTNSGVVYDKQGNYSEAIEHHLKALKIYDQINDINGKASCYINLGAIYYLMQNYKYALEHFLKSAELFQQLNNIRSLSLVLDNIASIYYQQNKFESALKYFLEALKLRESGGFEADVARTLTNIGDTYANMGDFNKAIEYLERSLDHARQKEDQRNMVYCYSGLGLAYINAGKSGKAIEYLKKGIELANENKLLRELQILYERTTLAYEKLEDFKNAYHYQIIATTVKDSLLNEESNRQVTEMQTKYETEKKELHIQNLNKDNDIKAAEIKKQTIQKIGFASGFGLMLLLAFVIFRGYRQKKKANELISAQKTEVEKQKELVDNKNKSLEVAHQKIEEKNNEILDSIRYAKRIQEAILPPQKLVKSYLENSFILYKPKDIVAGDFYWMHSLIPRATGGEHSHIPPSEGGGADLLFACCDCTGHGVPGAFVSILGYNGLNRCVKEFGLTQPAAILDKLCELVDEAFSKSENDIKDGMDIALVRIKIFCEITNNENELNSPDSKIRKNSGFTQLQYAGAGNSLYLIRNGILTEIPADKQPIGKYHSRKPFTNHQIDLQKEDALYVFTDGYADQFGGPKGKKFKYAQFENLLVSIQDKSMTGQREIINDTIENWMNWPGSDKLEQIDDICLIGVKI